MNGIKTLEIKRNKRTEMAKVLPKKIWFTRNAIFDSEWRSFDTFKSVFRRFGAKTLSVETSDITDSLVKKLTNISFKIFSKITT